MKLYIIGIIVSFIYSKFLNTLLKRRKLHTFVCLRDGILFSLYSWIWFASCLVITFLIISDKKIVNLFQFLHNGIYDIYINFKKWFEEE